LRRPAAIQQQRLKTPLAGRVLGLGPIRLQPLPMNDDPLGFLAPMVAVLAPELVLLALRRAARRQSSGAEGEP